MKLSPTWIARLRWLLLALACLATLLALAVTVENWRGNRAWAAVERELKARGEKIDLAAFERPRVPDERNFFKAPRVEEIFFRRESDPERARLRAETKLQETAEAAGAWKPPTDFAALRTAFARRKLIDDTVSTANPAADVLVGLKHVAPLLDALRLAAHERDDAWLPASLSPTQHMIDADTIYNLGRLLALRATAALATNRVDDALADTTTILRLADVLQEGTPNMLYVLVGEALCGTASDVLKYGCAHHQWSDAQLRTIQQMLHDFQPCARLAQAMEGERAGAIYFLSGPRLPEMRPYWPRWIIGGWLQQNKVALAHLIARTRDAVDVPRERIFLGRIAQVEEASARLKRSHSPYVWFARMFSSNFPRMISRFGEDANGNQVAIVACALERYHLRHATYPNGLDALPPELLPFPVRDVFSGEPIRYARTADGYSLTTLQANGTEFAALWPSAP